ncbi:GNAT family N-acetyltransferase [Corynebacterium minutissimum]|uniref:Acetyltransferase n=1 Tax=Corynebacterium minutissimum TaxID=38301 RepID=A0A2X4REX4_9CORY|nr:GNAT family protein [Corynebacterium minutissimum]KHO29742.1 acetyltransferase [Corynebacterium minutissimum]QPS60724.1 GNAT family N-acetyltransferase [Corynebacterium minutissimum]QQA78489.1 GNAT family N-acetyltransferase [Corynebacterium minutissimum]SQI00383.1 acetyltransferase [Corynebacterium minutissimum]VEG05549.1 acetyltransferase [Corynebacterium minutissimum]
MLDPFGTAAGRLSSPASGAVNPDHPGWPEATPSLKVRGTSAFPQGLNVRLRPLLRSDGSAWRQQRIEDCDFLKPVEPTLPTDWVSAHSQSAWWNHLMFLRESARSGTVVPLVIEVEGQFRGQLTLGNIQHGGVSECWIGYWVHSGVHRAGIATAACALGVDHAFYRVGLHRVTATYLPENPASGKVLHNNGFRDEGFLRRNLHIDGAWRDHHFLALNREDFASSAVERLQAVGRVV